MAAQSPPLLTDLLEQVSRSFYWSMRVLPSPVRPPISLAYLLARTTDTIADTELVPVAERLRALENLAARIQGTGMEPVAFGRLAAQQGNSGERALLERAEEAIALLHQMPENDQRLIREVLATITSGQALDLKRFAGASECKVVALANADELHEYTKLVAGCVGQFWTLICLSHLFRVTVEESAELVVKGVRFGRGLQLVNILRDLPRDLRQGRCYLPQDELAAAGLQPADLLVPANENRLRPVYDQWLNRASELLATGWEYTNALPWGQARVRLACALPVLIGIKTLAKLKNNPILEPDLRIKVSRSELRGMVIRMLIWYPWPTTWRHLPRQAFFCAGKND